MGQTAQRLVQAFGPRRVKDQPEQTSLGYCWHRVEQYVGVGAQLRFWWKQLPNAEVLYENLQLVYRIGPWTEGRLRLRGVHDLRQLVNEPRFAHSAQEVLAAIGRAAVHELAQWGAEPPALLTFFQPEQLMFLDLETTGLAPAQPLFLVGVASLAEDDLWVDQYLARNESEEGAVLAAAAQRVKGHPVVCTFNGKSFDLPYLQQRSWFWRQPWDWHPWQVDLLTPSRRRYRYVLEDCRLETLCHQVLGRSRTADIPGALIPAQYRQFTEEGDWGLMEPILRHNAEDLLALSFLLEHLYSPVTPSHGKRQGQVG